MPFFYTNLSISRKLLRNAQIIALFLASLSIKSTAIKSNIVPTNIKHCGNIFHKSTFTGTSRFALKVYTMLKNMLNLLESPNNPLLGPNLKGLKLTGLLQPDSGFRKHSHNFFHFIAFLFVVSQYVELWLIREDLNRALRNLSVTMLSTVCVIKAFTFICWKDNWKDIINAVSELELKQISLNDLKTDQIMKKYIKYSRTVTFLYWSLVTATVVTLDIAPLLKYSDEGYRRVRDKLEPYPEIISSWLPFKSTLPGHCVHVIENIIITFYGGGIIAAYDSMAVVLMNFFAGQLKVLRMNCDIIFHDEERMLTDKEAIVRIKECHDHHKFLVKYSKIFNSLLSPVMFIYVIICSLMICSSVIQLTQKGSERMQQLWISEYVIALVSQLLLFCWHGNEVLFMSKEVDDGVYSSAWWTRNYKMRKSTLLLGGQLRKIIMFQAGPFTNLSLNAFVTILKGSYSYYTILNKNAN